VDGNGLVMPAWTKWLREVENSAMREVTDANTPPVAPVMKSGEMIVFKATGVGKTYLVYYDGTNRFYWEATGTDLY
jgi:hypothetical protein